MSEHLTSAEITGLARGTLSRAGRRHLVAHMVHGCAQCSRLLAPALSLPSALLRRPDSPAVEAGQNGDVARVAAEDAYDVPVARACAEALRCHRALERERRRASAGAAERSLGGLLRIEILLAASWDLRENDTAEMVRTAELALFAAEKLDPARYGRPVIADVRARGWAELANAYRVAEEPGPAEEAMAAAMSWRRRGSGDPWLVARIADLMASLLADQGRYGEARELLGKVHQFYRRVGDHQLAGRALISRGIFTGYDNEPRQALVLLCAGLELIDLRQDAQLAIYAVHAILWNLVLCGRFRQARIQLWRSRALLISHGSPLFLLRVRWLEGRTHAGLGDFERAERELLATRRGFEDAGSPYNSALVALDLAVLWLQQGRTREVRLLVDETIATFRALRIAREAVAALLILREACDYDEATLGRFRAAIVLLTELERQPHRRRAAPLASAATARATPPD